MTQKGREGSDGCVAAGGETAALAEGLSKGPRQHWGGFVQGTVRRLSAPAPASSSLHLFTRVERGNAAPWGSSQQSQGDEQRGLTRSMEQGPAQGLSLEVRTACSPQHPAFQDIGWPHSWRRTLSCVRTGRHSLTPTALDALRKLESQLGQDGDWHECAHPEDERASPARSPVLVVPFPLGAVLETSGPTYCHADKEIRPREGHGFSQGCGEPRPGLQA